MGFFIISDAEPKHRQVEDMGGFLTCKVASILHYEKLIIISSQILALHLQPKNKIKKCLEYSVLVNNCFDFPYSLLFYCLVRCIFLI